MISLLLVLIDSESSVFVVLYLATLLGALSCRFRGHSTYDCWFNHSYAIEFTGNDLAIFRTEQEHLNNALGGSATVFFIGYFASQHSITF